jgi:murein DD-endopeptidase MepM/ murein hydrolase activator NlpD
MKTYKQYNVPFRGGFSITQYFGNNPLYYGQFGLAGHEGVDVIPYEGNNTLYAIEDGIVLRDNDIPRNGGAYGNYTVIWNATNRRAWWYCHMAVNYVFYGQRVSFGQRIGVMGSTGNSSGPHLHLGLRYSDSRGYPINVGNGYQGYIDPLPVLLDIGIPSNQSSDEPHPYNTDQNPYRSGQRDDQGSQDTTHPYNTNQNPYRQNRRNNKNEHPYNTDQNPYRRSR